MRGNKKTKMSQEFSPVGSSLGPASPEQIRRIQKGGKIADKIRKKRELEHEISEIPAAEDFLENAVWGKAKEDISPTPDIREKVRKNIWERFLKFLEKGKES